MAVPLIPLALEAAGVGATEGAVASGVGSSLARTFASSALRQTAGQILRGDDDEPEDNPSTVRLA